MLLSYYRPTSPHQLAFEEFPVLQRDAAIEMLPQLKKFYPDYSSFARTPLNEILDRFNRNGESILQVNSLTSGWWENRGNFKFKFHSFPTLAQVSPVSAIHTGDLDGDKKTDLLLAGNDEGMAVIPGRADASCGLILKGDGKGSFSPMPLIQAGLFVTGDIRSIHPIPFKGNKRFVTSEINGPVRVFQLRY
jgi:enediyne biosynthesis protein E4